ncbi:MAG: hypothetical protein N2200_05120 [Bacteroidia bacterium]|nr:hypothetical protein [Bacteroidia bacterium]
MKRRLLLKIMFIVTIPSLMTCKREKKDGNDELGHALVTTIEVTLIQNRDTIRGRYKDPDGPGGRRPTIDTLRPKAESTYTYILQILDESGNPTQNLTDIIFAQQKNTHRMYFFPEPDTLASIQPTDADDFGRPVGGKGIWRQGPASVPEGTVRFVLRHYLNSGEKEFGLERGSTDIDIKLPIRIRN